MIPLTFKKVGNHWYLDIPHSDPRELILDRRFEYILSKYDVDNDQIKTVYLHEQPDFIIEEGLLQFREKDLQRYFLTNDDFQMKIWVGGRRFTLSSDLYTLLENQYHLNLHLVAYRITIYEI